MDTWEKLSDHHKNIANAHMRELLAADPERASRYSITLDGLYINYSRHRVTDETLDLLFSLADKANLKKRIAELFAGADINTSEQRPALHTALRADNDDPLMIADVDVRRLIRDELLHMEKFIRSLHQGKITGATGRPINTLINIGIGGSDLGPRLVCEALQYFKISPLDIRFVANIDYREISNALAGTDPETTLFIVSSKSFSTQETLTNARTARDWLIAQGCEDTGKHFIAVTANPAAAESFGIAAENIFRIWDWVGGRYSIWSAIGLPVAAAIGMDHYRSFLAGAARMDRHFRTQPFPQNMPVILGLLDDWYINFFNSETLAVIPYDQSLKLLPEYLGQLMMESNGKSIGLDNETVSHKTAPVVWGGVGTNAQHAFMQLLYQGTRLVPVDFLVGMRSTGNHDPHHRLLVANCLAQSEALTNGTAATESGPAYKHINGNNPNTVITYEQLTPEVLGMLLALYEHRTFVQAMLWNVNPFDQWGVELGKKVSKNILDSLENKSTATSQDAVTRELIRHYLASRGQG